MKISHSMQGGTVGHLAAFLAHALANGVGLDEQIAMRRDRSSDIVEISIDVTLAGFASPQAAAGELRGTATGKRYRGRVGAKQLVATAPPPPVGEDATPTP